MKHAVIASAAAALSLTLAAPAFGALAVGAQAPDFNTRGAKGGEVMDVKLSALLKKGPVVIFFFPKAFTAGCTVESKEFADNVEKFTAAGATVLGMSADPVDMLAKFSTETCGSKIAMASAGPAIISGYDVAFGTRAGVPAAQTAGITNRTSYVIAKSGKIAFVLSDNQPRDHVKSTLAAVETLKKGG